MINIGDVLLAFGIIDRAALDKALAAQRREPTKRLGQHLIDMRLATRAQINECLVKQKAMRQGRAAGSDVKRLADYAVKRACENVDVSDLKGYTGLFDVSELRQAKQK